MVAEPVVVVRVGVYVDAFNLYYGAADTDLAVAHQEDKQGVLRAMATTRRVEEKGSDVNVATRLLQDVLTGQVDAAVIVSNDSDLALPATVARQHMPRSGCSTPKADTMVRRFVTAAVGAPALVSKERAEGAVKAAASRLDVTERALDHAIWLHQRRQPAA